MLKMQSADRFGFLQSGHTELNQMHVQCMSSFIAQLEYKAHVEAALYP